MSIIYPGNYVAQLNAYRGQGVEAIPGFNFYSAIGVGMVETAGTTVDLKILSPDLRQDDKPRLDKPFEVPANAKVYSTAINSVNVKGTGAGTLTVGGGGLAAVLTAVAGEFTDVSAAVSTDDLSLGTVATGGTATAVTVTSSASIEPKDTGDQAYVIVEVCYWLPAAAPTSDDVHVPFKVEAGQGT